MASNKKLVHLMLVIPSLAGGGAEKVLITLLRHFDRTQFRLTLCVGTTHNAVFLDDVPDDVNVLDLACSRIRHAIPKLIRTISRHSPDVVFSTLGHLNLALALCRPLLPAHTRFIGREASIVSEVMKQKRYSIHWRWAYRLLYKRFDHVICQSRFMADDLIHNIKVPSDIVSVIHNPIDVQRVQSLSHASSAGVVAKRDPQTLRLLAVGRLAPVKGFDLLIEAVARCQDMPLQLVILGDGTERAALQALAEKLGVTDRVIFQGFQENPYPHFLTADAFILSSRFEGFPNVILEALACGAPVLATPAPGGTQEILHNVPCSAVASAISSAAIAQLIRQWFARHPIRPTVDMACVAPYQADRIVQQYQELFLRYKEQA